jgi:enamine deaminase RidA (YjgF/YER057c/UK114 family)
VSPELLLTGKARSRAACGLRDVSLPPWLIAVPPWRIALVPRLVASHICLLVAARAAILEKVVHLSGDTPLDSTQIIGVEVRAPVVMHIAKYLRAARGIGMLMTCAVQVGI